MTTRLTDGKDTVVFPIDPEIIKVAVTGEYSSNNVLGTYVADIRPKYSSTSYRIDRLLFISKYGALDFRPRIDQLQVWARLQTRLKLLSPVQPLEGCYIKAFTIDPKRYKNRAVYQAEGSLELLVDRPSKPIKGKEGLLNLVGTEVKRTRAEVIPFVSNILSKWREFTIYSSSKSGTALGRASWNPFNQPQISVDDQGIVTITQDGKSEQYDYDTLLAEYKYFTGLKK